MIDNPQTVLNFVSCSQSTYRIAQKFAQLKLQQLTHITTNQSFANDIFTTTIYPSGWSKTRDNFNQLYSCGKIKNRQKQGSWKQWDIWKFKRGSVISRWNQKRFLPNVGYDR